MASVKSAMAIQIFVNFLDNANEELISVTVPKRGPEAWVQITSLRLFV